MVVVSDSMVLIHLAKITVLEKACDYFKGVIIPPKVFSETVEVGRNRGFEDAVIIDELVKKQKIMVKKIKNNELVKKAAELNVFGGEAGAVALYWEEKEALIATDDDNVRSKKELLEIKIIGTPSIILALHQNKIIDSEKLREAVSKLRKIGWFGSQVLDKIIMEAEKNE